jgi:hypothetical protein
MGAAGVELHPAPWTPKARASCHTARLPRPGSKGPKGIGIQKIKKKKSGKDVRSVASTGLSPCAGRPPEHGPLAPPVSRILARCAPHIAKLVIPPLPPAGCCQNRTHGRAQPPCAAPGSARPGRPADRRCGVGLPRPLQPRSTLLFSGNESSAPGMGGPHFKSGLPAGGSDGAFATETGPTGRTGRTRGTDAGPFGPSARTRSLGLILEPCGAGPSGRDALPKVRVRAPCGGKARRRVFTPRSETSNSRRPSKPISLSVFASRGNDCDGWHLAKDLR